MRAQTPASTTDIAASERYLADWMADVSDDKELPWITRFVGVCIALGDPCNAASIAATRSIKKRDVANAIAALKARGWLDDRGRPSTANVGGQS